MRLARAVLVLSLALLWFPATSAPAAARPSLKAYRGLGSWVDIYEAAYSAPEATVQEMKANGVRTIFIETSNYSRDRAILYPGLVGRFIDAAHREGMNVVAWYLPSFANLTKDFRRSMAAIRFRSSGGGSFDSFALDIEASVVANASSRTTRLLRLSARIRAAAGASYPLGAITPNPVRLETDPGFWPDFPYSGLTRYFDVFVPMDYFGSVAQGLQAAHDYTTRGIRLIRQQAGDPAFPIHMIGGLASYLGGAEVRGFVHAVRERGLIGASLYNFSEMSLSDWEEMAGVPVNRRQSPALPASARDPRELGNIPGSDRTHPQEVFYRAGGKPGTWNLYFEVFDVRQDELELWVNWRRVAVIDPTDADSWSTLRTLGIPGTLLRDDGPNYFAFVAAGRFPDWSKWGVRNVSLVHA